MKSMQVELFIPGELKDEPIISDMIRNFKIDMKIIEASFSAESGWALLVISGAKDEIERIFDHLKNKGINVQVR